VSEFYLGIGVVTLLFALFTPWIGRFIARRHLYSSGNVVMIAGSLMGAFGGSALVPLAVLMNALALVVLTICASAYLMDYIERTSMGKNETLRLLYSGLPWSVGPFLGVWLMDRSPLAPFMLSIAASLCQLAYFWYLRLGDGKVIAKALRPPANPLAYMPRFLVQPLLVAGWLFAVIRSVGWQIYIVYLPIFAIESGMSEQIGGLSLSVSNAFLFLTPLMLRFLHRTSVRTAIIVGFCGSAALFIAAMTTAPLPPVAVACLLFATLFLVSLDVSGGLPFLMSVKPSERNEMAAIYATFRDVSAVLSPAFARLILGFAPLAAVFGACGLALLSCALIARQLHPRLGKKRLR
jgi:MFS family permease